MNSSRASPTPSFGNEREAEGLLRIADVHHDLGLAGGRASSGRAVDVEVEPPLVDEAGLALRAADGDQLAVSSSSVPCSVPTTAGKPSSRLTMAAWQVRPPRLVTIAAAFFMIGSQSGSVLSVTRTSPGLELPQILDALDDAHRARGDLLADAAARDEDGTAAALEVVGLDAPSPGLRDWTVSGRACTMKSSPVRPSLAHSMSIGRRLAALFRVVLLDQAGPAGELENVVVGRWQSAPVARRDRDILHHLAAADVVDELELLVAETLLQNRPKACLQRGLEDVELVGIHRALDDVLAEAVGRVDQHDVAEARSRYRA